MIGFKTCRDADIIHAERSFKRMRSLILPAARPIVPEAGHYIRAKIPKFLLVIFFMQEGIFDLFRGRDLFDQFHLRWAQGIENSLHVGSLHAWLVIIEQRVIRMIGGREE